MDQLANLLNQGGPLMYPLLACSVLALGIFIERLVVLQRRWVVPQHLRSLLKPYLLSKDYDGLRRECLSSQSSLGRVVYALIQNPHESLEDLKDILYEAGKEELPFFQRRLPVLASIATISPLLGLLGTVLGMIEVFGVISSEGLSSDNLSKGISEALLTTAAGLSIAIPAYVFHQILMSRVQILAHELDHEGGQVIRLLRSTPQASGTAKGSAPHTSPEPATAPGS